MKRSVIQDFSRLRPPLYVELSMNQLIVYTNNWSLICFPKIWHELWKKDFRIAVISPIFLVQVREAASTFEFFQLLKFDLFLYLINLNSTSLRICFKQTATYPACWRWSPWQCGLLRPSGLRSLPVPVRPAPTPGTTAGPGWPPTGSPPPTASWRGLGSVVPPRSSGFPSPQPCTARTRQREKPISLRRWCQYRKNVCDSRLNSLFYYLDVFLQPKICLAC